MSPTTLFHQYRCTRIPTPPAACPGHISAAAVIIVSVKMSTWSITQATYGQLLLESFLTKFFVTFLVYSSYKCRWDCLVVRFVLGRPNRGSERPGQGCQLTLPPKIWRWGQKLHMARMSDRCQSNGNDHLSLLKISVSCHMRSDSWRTPIAVLCVQLPSGHASSHGHTTVSAIEASVRQARVCGTVCHRTYDKTRTSRVSSVNWKHFCLGIRQPRRIVTVAIVRHRNTLSYLHTYLLT